jgi:hypothetical protein
MRQSRRTRASKATGGHFRHNDPLLSCLGLVGLQDEDGFGDLVGAPGAAAELGEDLPGLELGVARSPGERSFVWTRLAAFGDSGMAHHPGGEGEEPGGTTAAR